MIPYQISTLCNVCLVVIIQTDFLKPGNTFSWTYFRVGKMSLRVHTFRFFKYRYVLRRNKTDIPWSLLEICVLWSFDTFFGSCVWFLILRSARGRRNGEHRRGLASYVSYIKNHLCVSSIVLILLMIKYAINLMLIVRNRFCHTRERFSWRGLPFHKNESLSTIVLCTEISTHITMHYDHSYI